MLLTVCLFNTVASGKSSSGFYSPEERNRGRPAHDPHEAMLEVLELQPDRIHQQKFRVKFHVLLLILRRDGDVLASFLEVVGSLPPEVVPSHLSQKPSQT